MRDKKDHATLDLLGFDQIACADDSSSIDTGISAAAPIKRPAPRPPAQRAAQEQLELLAPTDASGLPVWQRDDSLDLTGLPVWAAA